MVIIFFTIEFRELLRHKTVNSDLVRKDNFCVIMRNWERNLWEKISPLKF